MKKICFITTVSYTLNTFVLDIAKYLHENSNYEITFICDYNEEFEKSLPEYIRYIPVSMKRGASLDGLISIRDMYKIFKTNKFDIVQYSTPNASLYASLASRMAKIPYRIYCQWGMFYTGLYGINRLIFKNIEKLICYNSTYVEPDSYGNMYFSWEEGLYSSIKSGVVWNGSAIGVDLKKFDLNKKLIWRKEIRKEYGLSTENKVVGYVGRITKDKGIEELLKSMKTILDSDSQIRLMLIGEIENAEKLDKQLLDWAKQDDRILFCGTTKETEKFYSAMDLLVLPSYREGFGMVVVEAEAMGLPVIVTNIPGPTEAIIPDKTGIVVEKKNYKDLSRAIMYLLMNDDIRWEMGSEGRKFVENNFEKERFMEKLLYIRENLVI